MASEKLYMYFLAPHKRDVPLDPKSTKKVKAAEKGRYMLRLASEQKGNSCFALKQPFCFSYARLDVYRPFSEASDGWYLLYSLRLQSTGKGTCLLDALIKTSCKTASFHNQNHPPLFVHLILTHGKKNNPEYSRRYCIRIH